MYVLVVNAFGDPNNKKFEEFLNQIKKIFKKLADKSGIEQVEYIIRNYNDVDDYLTDLRISDNQGSDDEQKNFLNQKVKIDNKKFEKLDFIFIDGNDKFLPWKNIKTKYFNKISILIKMCNLANKPLFTSGVGFQNIIYFLSTNFNTDLNIINSNEEIKSIENLNKISPQILENMKKNDYFLDFVSGDLYLYDKRNKMWVPFSNVGVHNDTVLTSYNYRGKYITPKTSYRPHSVSQKSKSDIETYMNFNTEIKIQIEKRIIYHWLLKNISLEFIADFSTKWFAHNVCLKYKELQYLILANCDKGPSIIEYKNTVATMFHINSKYEESVKILENFINKKFQEVQEKGFKNLKEDVYVPHNVTYNNNSMENFMNQNTTKTNSNINNFLTQVSPRVTNKSDNFHLVKNSQPFSMLKKTKKEATSVGFGFNKKDLIFVEDNSVNHRNIATNKELNYMNRPGSGYNTKRSFAFYTDSIRTSTTKKKSPNASYIEDLPINKNEYQEYVTDKDGNIRRKVDEKKNGGLF